MKKSQALLEAVMKSLLVEQGPGLFVTALNNISCHGEALIEHGCNLAIDQDDEALQEWFAGIDMLAKAAKKFENMT